MLAASIALLVLVALAALGILAYNRLVALKYRAANAFAQIDVQLKRRHDLIPNLLETARAYMAHERSTLDAVTSARAAAQSAAGALAGNPTDAQALGAVTRAEGALSASLGRLFAVAEAYPDLKANRNMMQLSEEIATTENKVAFARQAYNDSVMALNTALQSFPAVLFAGALGFVAAPQLEPIEAESERRVPTVRF